jgi:hypothetical protein
MEIQEHGKLLMEKAASYAPRLLKLAIKTSNITTGTEMSWHFEIDQYHKLK